MITEGVLCYKGITLLSAQVRGLCTSALRGGADLKIEGTNSPPKYALCHTQCKELQKDHDLIMEHISQYTFHLRRVM